MAEQSGSSPDPREPEERSEQHGEPEQGGGRPGMTPIDHPYAGRPDVPEGDEQLPGEWEKKDEPTVPERRGRPYGVA
ncbi:hypothetical protein NI17_008580 [Thermobifida halotolerans]|uniref:Uncharacterized protein n=1 Tax=Thermobifida halotolerans TaxID=483545 RepID=A0A399G879_9ACTN|nr:hypothetical protein [Thermobifida halotolerans]UOE21180.1 hypothetical protein NI17_008580 [Thermobifida halotolerans]